MNQADYIFLASLQDRNGKLSSRLPRQKKNKKSPITLAPIARYGQGHASHSSIYYDLFTLFC